MSEQRTRKDGRPVSRIAIVTSGCGIGSAAAVRLAADGMDVALLAPDEATCAEAVQRITALGGRAMAVGADVSDAASVDGALARVCGTLGDPGVLVNVVSTAAPGPLSGLPEHDWYTSTCGQLRGLFLVSRAVADPMIRNGWGRIVTIAGVAGPGDHQNATVRAGLAGFTRTIALELGPFGITSNVITPAMPGTCDPAGLIAALPFLVSDEAAGVSGQTVHIGIGA